MLLSSKNKRATAIEQFNALKREFFITAWCLATEYDFDDELRLTEKQIKQYNEILIDSIIFINTDIKNQVSPLA